ncbi:Acetyl-CoA acetyltransferase [bacterium HR19]|nr:Acetyl-CoA acetyltransferase [bacterium HR19]
MKRVYIVDAVRTPMGRFQGSLSKFKASELGAKVISALLQRNKLSGNEIDEVIMGNVLQAGVGQGPARQAAIFGGVAPEVPAETINKVCGSALKAVIHGAEKIALGRANMIIAGGMESMSNAPFLIPPDVRRGSKFGNMIVQDHMIYDGLWCAFENRHMGELAEYTAEKANITREEQDRFAYESHKKAVRATIEGFFRNEIVPIDLGKGQVLDRDETPRQDTDLEKLSKLKPAFKKDGSVTAGNSSSLNDGASAVLLMSEDEVEKRGAKPLARIVDWAVAAVPPREIFFAPIFSTSKLLEKLNLKIKDIDLIEINEAFASQTLADGKALGFDWSSVNINGGAIALGHPIGASGARILTTLIWSMVRLKAKRGLATLCIGGGMGISMVVELAV